MGVFDIILSIILLIAFIKGIKEGLFVEVASLIGLIAGIYGAIHFSYVAGDYLKSRVSWEERYITLLAFTITFIVIVLVISLAGKLLTKLANFAQLGWINKLAGGLFGSLKWALILSVIILVFDRFNSTITFVKPEDRAKSILYEPVKSIAPMLFPNFVKPKEVESKTTEQAL